MLGAGRHAAPQDRCEADFRIHPSVLSQKFVEEISPLSGRKNVAHGVRKCEKIDYWRTLSFFPGFLGAPT